MNNFGDVKTAIQFRLDGIVVYTGQLGTVAPGNEALSRKLYSLKHRLAKVIHGQELLDLYNQGATIELRKRGSRHIVLDGVSHASSLKNCDDFEAIVEAIVEAIASLEIEEEEEDNDYEEYRDLNPDYEEYPENVDFHNDLLDEIYD